MPIDVTPRGNVWRLSLVVAEAFTEPFELLLGRFSGAVSSRADAAAERWTVEGYADTEPERPAVEAAVAALAGEMGIGPPAVRIDLEPAVDWLTQNRQAFPPVRWGRYWIAGTHVAEPPPPGTTPVRIDAGTAFGSGEHPTTGGCLTLIDRLAKRRRTVRTVLDLGSGSGILGIAASRTWTANVTAADIDPESVRVTRRHAAINGVARRIDAVVAESYRRASIRRSAPYDLIVANILARPLSRLSAGLGRNLAPGGVAIISGLLTRDGPWMIACHRRAGLHVADRIEIDGWLSLMLRG